MAEAASEDAKASKKLLQLNNPLKLYLANVLTTFLDCEVKSEEKVMLKVLEAFKYFVTSFKFFE